jgi:hypothetical protein
MHETLNTKGNAFGQKRCGTNGSNGKPNVQKHKASQKYRHHVLISYANMQKLTFASFILQKKVNIYLPGSILGNQMRHQVKPSMCINQPNNTR